MKFTDSSFERMMKEVPRAPRPEGCRAFTRPACRTCPDWPGMACMGVCHRMLTLAVASGQLGPKLVGSRDNG